MPHFLSGIWGGEDRGNRATDFDGGYVVLQRLVKAAAVIGFLAFIIVAIPALGPAFDDWNNRDRRAQIGQVKRIAGECEMQALLRPSKQQFLYALACMRSKGYELRFDGADCDFAYKSKYQAIQSACFVRLD